MSRTIELDALDTLFFRDGKPFSMGEESWADGLFPPPPSVIYGALRTAYFAEDISRFASISQNDLSKCLSIKSLFYKIANQIYFPAPLDLVEISGFDKDAENATELRKMGFLPKEGVVLKNDFLEVLGYDLESSNHKMKSIEDCLINSRNLRAYLLGEKGEKIWNSDYLRIDASLISEPKIGIRLNAFSGTTDDAFLYRVGMKRSVAKTGKLKIGATFSFDELDTVPGMLRLGGEGKSVHCKRIEDKSVLDKLKMPCPELSGKEFKLYLSTPAIFAHDWKPFWMKEGEYFEYDGIDMRLKAAVIGKPFNVGGFDVKNRKPKEMHKAVPAGSVYYLELKNESDCSRLRGVFYDKTISDDEDFSKQGYGITFIGVV